MINPGNEFYIYNYLRKSIRVDILVGDANKTVSIPITREIKPNSKQGFKIGIIEKYFTKGNKIRVCTLNPQKEYGVYVLDTPENETIKALHIGMITSRWTGADGDYNIGKQGLNAVQGLPWIKIHNRTNQFIRLNENITIAPYSTLRYTGRDHFGVRLGTIFKDKDGIYPTFKFTVPATDVYYGVISDLQQSLFGGWQPTPDFIDGLEEPHHLLEMGWMGGPGKQKIPLGYLPRDGPPSRPVNRWGQHTAY
jgi:hypothetical protein